MIENIATYYRKDVRRSRRRSAIVAVAARSFLKHGYADTSMTAISSELGGSKSTLWAYFPSKERLFTAVLEDRISAYQEEIHGLLSKSDDLHISLLNFCRAFIAKAASPEVVGLHRLVISERTRFPEIGRIFRERASRQTHSMIINFVDNHVRRGAFRGGNSSDVVQVLRSLCISKQFELLTEANALTSAQVEAEASRLTGIFLRVFEVN